MTYGALDSQTIVSTSNPLPVGDAGGSLTVDNAALSVTGGGVEATALRVTIATDSTGVLSVDDNGSTISIDDGAGSITVDGTVTVTDGSGSLTVDGTVTANLAAGTNNIGDVDVLSIVPGTGATNLGKAEDGIHATGDVGVMALFVRQDAQADFGADGDYVPGSIDADGALRVNVINGAAGGTSAADDADFTDGTTSGTPAMGVYESTPTTVTDGDLGVVGITETRALKVAIDSGGVTGRAEDSAHSTGHEGLVMLAVRRDTAAVGSDTDGDYSTVNVDANGRVHVNVGNTVTVGSHAVTNAGTFAVQVDGNALTALQLIDNSIFADDAAYTIGTSSVNVAGFVVDETATDSADEGDAVAGRATADRKQIVTPYPHTAGGLTIFRSIDLDETEEEIKATAGQVYGMWVTNTATSTRFVKFYNATAANVSVGTTTPVITIGIPGNTSDDVSGNFGPGGMGIAFATAITVAATTGVLDNDTGAPGANEVIVNVFYA